MPTTIHYTGVHGPFTKVQDLLADLAPRLTADGMFTQVYPTALTVGATGPFIFEPTNKVDSLRGVDNSKPTWRMAFTQDESKETISVNIATKIQIKDDGSIATGQGWTTEKTTLADGKSVTRNPGELKKFVDRSHLVLPGDSFNLCAVYPMSYALTVSDHGVFLGIWDNAMDDYQNEFDNVSPAFRWFVIQRPVDNQTGEPLVTGRAPVFCAYTTMALGYVQSSPEYHHTIPGFNIQIPDGGGVIPEFQYGELYILMRKAVAQFHYKFVVCEEDVFRPSLSTLADMSQPDSNPIFNSAQMVSVSEDNKYVVTIPKGLNTPRYAYTHELDMMAYTSADVIGMHTEVELPVYGGTQKYRALVANRLKNTGMRILYRVA